MNKYKIYNKGDDMMTEKQLRNLKKLTILGFIIGLFTFLCSFIGTGIQSDYILFIGLGIMVSSILIFGFFLFIMAMEEVSTNRQKV